MAVDAAVLASTPLLAIVRFRGDGEILAAVDALHCGGIELVEITLDTPGALAAVEHLAETGRSVGVGTVVTGEQARAAAAAGAQFVVSPGLVPEVIDVARSLDIEPMPGVYTATEILAAGAAGATVMKLFPAASGGASYLQALRGPFPDTPLVPTGGIGLDEVQTYLEAGAAAVALGSRLVGRSAPRSDSDIESIVERAARAVAAAREARSEHFDQLARRLAPHSATKSRQ